MIALPVADRSSRQTKKILMGNQLLVEQTESSYLFAGVYSLTGSLQQLIFFCFSSKNWNERHWKVASFLAIICVSRLLIIFGNPFMILTTKSDEDAEFHFDRFYGGKK